MENNELIHHGIKGQRWGRRRYQNKDGSLTAEGIKRYQEKDPEGYAKMKQETLKSGSASDVLKFRGDLSTKELQEAFTRLDYENRIKNLSSGAVKSSEETIKSISSKIGTLTDAANKGINAWNVIAKINNAFSENELPVIDGASMADKKKKKQKEFEEEQEKAEKKVREEWLRKARPEDVIKNWSNLSTEDIKNYNSRQKFKDNIDKAAEERRQEKIKNMDDWVKNTYNKNDVLMLPAPESSSKKKEK